jgi:hypothetical protein
MPLRIQAGAKVIGFAAETKAEAFWSKKSSKGKEEGHAQGRAQLPLDQHFRVRVWSGKGFWSRCIANFGSRNPEISHSNFTISEFRVWSGKGFWSHCIANSQFTKSCQPSDLERGGLRAAGSRIRAQG